MNLMEDEGEEEIQQEGKRTVVTNTATKIVGGHMTMHEDTQQQQTPQQE